MFNKKKHTPDFILFMKNVLQKAFNLFNINLIEWDLNLESDKTLTNKYLLWLLKFRADAREQFLNNIPEVLSNLVGQQSARRGAMKVFETLQDPRLNKQLFYVSDTLLQTFLLWY